MCDQMRWDAMACAGDEQIQTPNLDRLAARGIRFTNGFTPNPICVPARASLTTGCYPHKCTGRKNNSGAIKDEFPKLGEEFVKRGYKTYCVGKLHYNPYAPPGEPRTLYGLETVELMESGRYLQKFDPNHEGRGLEDYHDYLDDVGWDGYTRAHGLGNNDVFPAPSPLPAEHSVDTWIADRSIHYLKEHLEHHSDTPFFLWSSSPKPHSAFDPPRPFDAMYSPRDMRAPTGSPQDLNDRKLFGLYALIYDFQWESFSPQAMKNIRAHYYGLITHMDQQIGRILDYLEEAGVSDNTLIAFVADHGDMLGDFGLFFKSNHYNGSVRVPYMLSWPGHLPEGLVSDELVGLQDILPTFMAATGEPLSSEVDGMDLLPVCEGETAGRSEYVAQTDANGVQSSMICTKRWKYIYHELGGVEELYDQVADVYELTNLTDSPDHQELKQSLREKLLSWCVKEQDTQLLSEGDFVTAEPRDPETILPKKTKFGRRHY